MAARRGHFLDTVAAVPAPFALRLRRTDAVLAHARLAGTSASRRRGLLGRDVVARDEGLVIAPTQGIHTFGMRVDLDVVFVDRDGVVVRVAAAVPPRRLRLAWRAFAAIEVCAGRAAELDVRAGDRIDAVLLAEARPPAPA
jgi:uncharacterized membrane protein (UPF0127 family)